MVKTAHLIKDGSIKLVDTERPVLEEEGAVLLKTQYSEVCGTDVHLQQGHLAGVPYPIILGHVSTGIIEEINGLVTDIDGIILKIGDPITFLDVHETCNNCYFCLVAQETTRCPNRKVYGITYSADDGLLGGWSEYIYLKPGVKIIILPDREIMKTFIAGGCGLPTAIHAIKRSQIQFGDTVVVQGSGPVGLMLAVTASLSGAFKVIMVGGPANRLDIAQKFGIETIIDIFHYDAPARVQQVLDLTHGRGADVTIEATGVPSAIKEGLQMTRDGGSYTIVGQYTNAGDITINPHLDINKKHITVRGSWGSDFSHFYLATKFIEKYKDAYPWDKIISKEYSLEGTAQALKDVADLKIMKAIINPWQ